MNAFHWREQRALEQPKPISPQLAYFHRKMELGTHPRQLRKQGEKVLNQSVAVALSNKQIAKRIAVTLSNKTRAAKQKIAISELITAFLSQPKKG